MTAISFEYIPGTPWAFAVHQLNERGFTWDSVHKTSFKKEKLEPHMIPIIGAIIDGALKYVKDVVINGNENDTINTDKGNTNLMFLNGGF